MAHPLVSVIIPNFNYAQYLPQALDSVLAQTYRETEIIVVDDESTDDSEAVVSKYGGRVRFIKQKNQGVSAARNRGVAASHGDLIAFIDADDAWLPAKLDKQVPRILADPDVGLVHCAVEQVGPSGASLGSLRDGMEGSVSTEFLLFQRPVVIAAGSTALIPRKVFEEVGGFDTRLSTSADWDLCYRIALKWKVAFVAEELVKYRIHTSNMHANIKRMEHDMLLCYDKAFAAGAGDAKRRQCYGNLHLVLAGSYFRAGQHTDFVRQAVKSVWLTPANLKRLLGFPLRWYRREGQQ
jgi:glycosyltransferase involved in cell wall biosynthesis